MGKPSRVIIFELAQNRTGQMGLASAGLAADNQALAIYVLGKIGGKLKTHSVSLAVKTLNYEIVKLVPLKSRR